ncbi:MAG TPA: DUF5808 domain-containing protein [Vicinamibacterales bacterium]|nr:DUF5808 domain-containing protein [Vicinamibacterales bacterium]
MKRRWSRPTRSTLVGACWAAGITLATASYLALIYPTLPDGLPVRYMRGEPVFFQVKTPLVVMLPSLVQMALLLTFGAIGLLLLWRARPDTIDSASEADSARMRLAVQGVALLGAVWITVQALGAARLVAVWQGGRGGFGRVYNIAVLISLVVSTVIVWRTMRAVRQEGPSAAEVDPSMWRFSNLYFNPLDPSLFVPTRRGVGWTLNFGRPLAIILIAGVLIVGIGGPFLLARAVLWNGAFAMLRIGPP